MAATLASAAAVDETGRYRRPALAKYAFIGWK